MRKSDDLHDFKGKLGFKTRVLGVDFGKKKLGLSLSDRDKLIASPLKLVIRKGLKADLLQIEQIIKELSVDGIVFGYPVAMSGEITDSCKDVEKFAEELSKKLELPYYFQDERMSTMAVRQILKQTNMTWQKKNQIDDMMAASYVLQIVLDMMQNIPLNENGGLGGT